MTPTTDIVRKIQKLLQLGQSPVEAEATLAMARAQELMAKYNLEMAMIQATYVEGGTQARPEEKRDKVKVSRSAQYKWQRELWAAIAEVNFCFWNLINVYEGKRGTKQTTSKVRVKRHMLLGRESNVIAARMMGEYIEDAMERMVTTEGGFTNQERLSRSAISWKSGVADRVIERLKEKFEAMQEQKAAAAEGCTAIALRDVVQMEYEANYDARMGRPGAYRQKLLRDEEWEKGAEERAKHAEEARIEAERKWAEYLLTETPEQKKKREREEQKERIKNEKYWERQDRKWNNERWREASKVDNEAYSRGKRAGSKINLDAQVPETSRTSAEKRLS